MTATDRLHELLDERGVEYYEHEAPATDCVAFFDGRGWHDCWESVDGEVNVTFSMTPEQAIAATLGAGTLTAEQVSNATYAHSIHADCADADWQAIADELNTTLGSGTCHMEYCDEWSGDELYPTEAYVCSACGYITEDGKPNYCPNCGRKIEVKE